MWKGVYPYEYIDEWEKFNEISLPKKECFCSNLHMEDITDSDYNHTKSVCKDVFRNLSARLCKTFFSSMISIASRFKKD